MIYSPSRIYLLLTIFAALCLSCKLPNCYHSIKEKYPVEMAVMRNTLLDTLERWSQRRLRPFASVPIDAEALSDTMLPNCDGSRVVLLYSLVDPDSNAVFDQLQFLGADNSTGRWKFYCKPFPSYSFDRSQLSERRNWSAAEMVNVAYNDLLRSGYVDSRCKINCLFWEENNFFTDDLDTIHNKYFLTDSLPK
jgi:hypothetical protein